MRRELNDLEEKIYNEGERLIFGVSHDIAEDIRHRSSYLFFKKIIELDVPHAYTEKISIVDFGCGVGHGCSTLAEIANAKVLGVDISEESLMYAQEHFNNDAIQYKKNDLVDFAEKMDAFDYVVSRGVLEHIPNGLSVAMKARWTKRLIFDVPYDEIAGNPHHIMTGIKEESFEPFSDAELFYQDLAGNIFNRLNKPPKPNMIICVCSAAGLPKVESRIKFPVSAWEPKVQDKDHADSKRIDSQADKHADISKKSHWYDFIRFWKNNL